jgi:hypothetical protein
LRTWAEDGGREIVTIGVVVVVVVVVDQLDIIAAPP